MVKIKVYEPWKRQSPTLCNINYTQFYGAVYHRSRRSHTQTRFCRTYCLSLFRNIFYRPRFCGVWPFLLLWIRSLLRTNEESQKTFFFQNKSTRNGQKNDTNFRWNIPYFDDKLARHCGIWLIYSDSTKKS